jgi:hypothetical protein
VIFDADGGIDGRNDARIIYTALADGPVYLVAGDDEGRTGDYTLTFSVAE